jgi:hypothetical protein
MKKIYFSLVLFFVIGFAYPQTYLTEAVDFTATDIDGVEHNLFDILDGGQYVCIDFFFTT